MFVQKKSNFTFTLFTLMLLSFGWGCDSQVDEQTLPPYTEEGKNTFGCYVNKKLWLPERCRAFLSNPQLVAVLSPDSNFFLVASRECDYEIFGFGIQQADTGVYTFKDPKIYLLRIVIRGIEYIPQNGSIQIKHLDWANRIVSGRFECEFLDKDSNLVKVEEGRFDVRAKEE